LGAQLGGDRVRDCRLWGQPISGQSNSGIIVLLRNAHDELLHLLTH
jgi:hypothetical protein